MAKELWEEVRDSFDQLNGLHDEKIKENFDLLGTVGMDLNFIHGHIMTILKLLCE